MHKSDVSNLLGVIDNLILGDPIQVQRSNMSAFGLLELTRKGRHRSLNHQLLTQSEPRATVETTALALLQQATRQAAAKPGIAVKVKAAPAVLDWLENHPELLHDFSRKTGSRLDLEMAK